LPQGSSLIRNRPPSGPYSSPLPRARWCSQGVGVFLCTRYPCSLGHYMFLHEELSVWHRMQNTFNQSASVVYQSTSPLQGYLAYKKPPPPLESLWEPRHGPIAGSYEVVICYRRGTPAFHQVAPAVTSYMQRGTSLVQNCLPIGPASRPMPRALQCS